MHYYQFNIGDYKTHTSHLTPMEDICYRRLLDYYYLHENPLINDIEKITRLIMLNGHSTDVQQVLNEFFILIDNLWYNNRADAEINAYKELKESKSKAGKASALKRLGSSKQVLSECSTGVQLNINNKPLTNNNKQSNTKGSRLPSDWIIPDEYIQFCNTTRNDLDAYDVAIQFKDYWISVAGSKGVKTDWFATWRNWVRRQEVSKSKFKNKSEIISDSQFDNWLNSTGVNENARLG